MYIYSVGLQYIALSCSLSKMHMQERDGVGAGLIWRFNAPTSVLGVVNIIS